MAMLVAHLGLLGIRLLFLQLLIISLITWALRQGLAESARWVAASTLVRTRVKALFSGANFRALLWTTTIYLFGNLVAGTAGPLLTSSVTQYHGSQAVATCLYSLAFVTAMLVTFFVFMRFSDRNYRTRKWLWGIGSIMGIASWAMFIVVPPITLAPILINIIVFAAAAALAGEAFYKVFSQELFPICGTGAGIFFRRRPPAAWLLEFFRADPCGLRFPSARRPVDVVPAHLRSGWIFRNARHFGQIAGTNRNRTRHDVTLQGYSTAAAFYVDHYASSHRIPR